MRVIATPNHSQRTFTLRVYHNSKLTSKYRTIRLDKNEFHSCLYNTESDWKQFLKSDEYYLVR